MANTIIAQVTSNNTRAHEDAQVLINRDHPDWSVSGFGRPSVVNCSSLGYIKKQHIIRVIGSLSRLSMHEIDECLKAPLGIA